MAVVHEGLLRGDDRIYAVKFNRAHGPADGSFETETMILESLHHPHIVPLVSHGTAAGGMRWLAMPLVQGRTLRALLDHSRSLTESEREFLLRGVFIPALLDICAAVSYAHRLGILHCDLKPSNMIVTPKRHTWLIDWGMARTYDRGLKAADPTGVYTVPPLGGTPGYMSPEQIRGSFELVGPWSDVWSLGAVLYELITGQRAYRRGRPGKMIRATLRKAPTQPRVRVDLPNSVFALGDVCGRALSPSPAQRPTSVDSFMQQVRAAMDRH
jgi:serine/threonine-protein kinase